LRKIRPFTTSEVSIEKSSKILDSTRSDDSSHTTADALS